MNARTLPTLNGGMASLYGGYRLFRFADGWTYDEIKRHEVATVVVDGFSVSTSELDRVFSSREVVEADDGRVTLNIRRGDVKHELDGTKFDSRVDANRAAYEAGALAFMWYEDKRLAAEASS